MDNNSLPAPFTSQEDFYQYLLNEVLTLNKFNGMSLVKKPAATGSSGSAGQIAYDSGYVYICVAKNTWKRAALTTW